MLSKGASIGVFKLETFEVFSNKQKKIQKISINGEDFFEDEGFPYFGSDSKDLKENFFAGNRIYAR